jgi:ketosteroid isomerase-like protein
LTPAQAIEALLNVDRSFGAAAARTDPVSAVSAMLAEDVIVANNSGGFTEGKDAVLALLRGLPLYASNARLQWSPIRAGISADGTHGFTLGYATVQRPDSPTVSLKYLTHWVKSGDQWRVLTFNRRLRPASSASPTMLPPVQPARMVAPSTDAARIGEFRRTLAQAEQDFSDYSQTAGLGPAFARFGHPEAINMGASSEPTFVIGPEAIGRSVGASSAGKPSPVSWNASKTFVASSGDLGINFGIIRQNGGEGRFPFFTIWYRKSTSDPWRYVAE